MEKNKTNRVKRGEKNKGCGVMRRRRVEKEVKGKQINLKSEETLKASRNRAKTPQDRAKPQEDNKPSTRRPVKDESCRP